MKKAELLQMIKDSTAAVDVNSSEAYEKYFPKIELTLRVITDDNFDLEGLSSIKEFKNKDSFEQFIKESESDVIKRKFEAILTDVTTITELYIKNNSKQLRRVTTAQAVYVDWLEQKQQERKKFMPIFISFFIILSLAVIAFSAMDAAEVFAKDTPMGLACAIISAVAGALDFVFGLIFFFYEHHDDKEKRNVQEEYNTAAENGTEDEFIKKYAIKKRGIVQKAGARAKQKVNVKRNGKKMPDISQESGDDSEQEINVE